MLMLTLLATSMFALSGCLANILVRQFFLSGVHSYSCNTSKNIPFRRQAAFTLIEIMVVMLIIGMAMSMMTVSMGDGNRDRLVYTESKALHRTMQAVLEDAVFYRRQLGVRFDLSNEQTADNLYDQWQYQILIFNDEVKLWQPYKNESFDEMQMMPGVGIELTIEDVPVNLGSIEKETRLFELAETLKEEKRIEPDLYFLSSGEMQNFLLTIKDEAFAAEVDNEPLEYRISGNLIGQLRFLLPGDELDDE